MYSQKNVASGSLQNFILSHIVAIYKLYHICDFERSLAQISVLHNEFCDTMSQSLACIKSDWYAIGILCFGIKLVV